MYLVKSHQATARRQELGSKLAHAKEIIRLIIIELVVPISLEMPVLIACIVSGQVYIPPIIISVTVSLFITHPVFDPIVVVIVMKPYRNFARNCWRSFRGVTPIEPTTNVISTNHA